ncbi:hypothetical protein LguiB_032954 [Lonicera macranthoides]
MAISSKSTTKQHIRSISFPTRSHPTTLRIQEKLNNIKTSQVSAPLTAKTICNTLSQFNKLYKCIDDLLNLPLTQQALSQYQHDNWVEGLLDGSVRLLDICGNTIDLVSQMKEHLGDVQSCLRRRKADLSIESSIAKFSSFRKKIKKDAKRSISSLKQIENEVGGLQMLKGKVPCEGELDTANELQRVDAALSTLCGYASIETEKLQIAQYKLEKAESCVEEIEISLEFRRVKCVDDLLNFPVTEQVSSQHKHEKWVDELLDGLVRLLDSCGNAMDLISQLKEHLGDARWSDKIIKLNVKASLQSHAHQQAYD